MLLQVTTAEILMLQLYTSLWCCPKQILIQNTWIIVWKSLSEK